MNERDERSLIDEIREFRAEVGRETWTDINFIKALRYLDELLAREPLWQKKWAAAVDLRGDAVLEISKLEAELRSAQRALDERTAEGDALRMGWWLSHGCSFAALYGDDGEMQCSACRIDFKRAAPRDIETGLKNARMLSRAARADAPAGSTRCPMPGCLLELLHDGAHVSHPLTAESDIGGHGAVPSRETSEPAAHMPKIPEHAKMTVFHAGESAGPETPT